ncbi:MAG: hypothetical protein ACXVBT_11640, partial [Flavisolibacter sp.]
MGFDKSISGKTVNGRFDPIDEYDIIKLKLLKLRKEMCNYKKLLTVLFLGFSVSCFAQGKIEKLSNNVITGFEQMAKVERLPLLFPLGTKKNRMISYDASGGNGFGLLLNTFKKYIDENGDVVIFDAYGPGCLYREQMNIWTNNGIGAISKTIRIKYYFDDEKTPRLDAPVLD